MRIYRLLLWLCPSSLRREYGAAMEETFALRIDDARAAGVRSRARLWRRELLALLVLAMTERWPARHVPTLDHVRKAGRMDAMFQEIEHAARRLARSPAFTVAAVLTLALAISANVSIFAVVHRVLLNPLPYGDPDRLVALDYAVPSQNVSSGLTVMSWQLYHQLSDHARTLDGIAAYDTGDLTVTGNGDPERIRVSHATPSLAPVLRVAPALGRWFSNDEGVPGGPNVVVLSHGFWARRYASDPGILGRRVILNGLPTEVVGVMPPAFAFPEPGIDLWLPAQSTRASATFLFLVSGVARLPARVALADARGEITNLIAALSRVSPNQHGIISTALPLRDAMVGRIADMLWLLLASVGLVLLVGCANVANLFLVRSDARQREIAVRQAIGASAGRIAHYFLAESALLSMAGTAVGLLLAWGAVRLLVVLAPVGLPRLEEVRLDGVVVLFAVALSVLATFALGAIPLMRTAPLALSLHESGRGQTASRGRHRARHILMASQVAFALVLLVGSGLMVRSFQKLRAVDPGFNATAALTFRIGLPEREYTTRRAAVAAHQAIIERLSALPGVTGVATSTCLPLAGRCFGNSLIVEGRPPRPGLRQIASFRAISGGYFEAMGIQLLRGRTIDQAMVARGEPNVVLNKALADSLFPGEDPIGKRVRSSTPPNSPLGIPPWLTIVGVVGNTPGTSLTEPAAMSQVYMPASIAGGPDIPANALIGPNVAMTSYVVRTATAADLTAAVRRAVAAVDPNLAVAQVRTLDQILERASAQMAFTMILLGIAAAVALALGIVGIYGVMSYIVSQRTGEIGVRLALGAAPERVARMIIRQGGSVALAGVGIGLAGALAASRLMASLLYGVTPRDPVVFAATTIILMTVALVACWLPARRASRLNPLEALRAE
jgi:putative ABC transport system permease protein